MNKLISLTRLQVKDFVSKYKNSMNVKNSLLANSLLLLVFGSLLFTSYQFSKAIYDGLVPLGMPQLAITSMYIISVVMMFFTGISFIVSTFFYAKDLKFLATLPVPESTIIFAKLSTVYLYLLGISGCILVPAMALVGLETGVSVSYILLSLLALLLTPILPLAISTLIILPIMRFVGNSRRRNLFSVIVGVIFMVLIIGFQILITKQENNPQLIAQLMMQENGILHILGSKFPPCIWVTEMIMGSLKSTVLFLLLTAGSLLLVRMLAHFFYRHTLLEFNQESTPVKAGALYFRERTKHFQLVRRHLLIIIKQPAFFLNTIVSIFLPIVMIGVILLSGEMSPEILRAPELKPFALLIYTMLITTPAIVAGISSTVISREGKTFWETRVLPISTEENLRARIHSTLIATLTGSVLLALLALLLLPLSPLDILLGSLICVTATLFFATADLIINILRPYLNWTNPTAAVKNNLNVLISLVIRVAVGAIGFGLFMLLGPVGNLFPVLLIGLFVILYLLSHYLVYHHFVHTFNQIDA